MITGESGTTVAENSFSFNASTEAKYGGLIEKNMFKQMRKSLSNVLTYILQIAPPLYNMHSVVSIFRLLQIGFPALCYGYRDFWKNDDVSYKTLSVLSIFFHLIPPDNHMDAGVYFLIIYIILTALLIISLLICAKYYALKASLPSFVPTVIFVYFSTCGYLFMPISFELLFAQLGKIIFTTVSQSDLILIIAMFIAVILLNIIYSIIFLQVVSQVLTFQPNNLMTATTPPQNRIVISVIVITSVLALGEYATKTVRLILIALAVIGYGVSASIVFLYGGIINSKLTIGFLSTCLSGGVMCIIMLIIFALDIAASFVYIMIFPAIFVVMTIISHFIISKIRVNYLQKLDYIMEDPEIFPHEIRSVYNYVNIVVSGFSNAHPFCINWGFLKLGIEHYPKHSMVWFIYAKFVAIYPEETQTLAWIYRNVVAMNIKGAAAKIIKDQSISIARQREANLAPYLKNKLNSLSKHTTSAKHKLRNVWGLAIQGNIADIEGAIKKASSAIEQSDSEILHLLRQFPNNRFVTRHYARFCKELKADNEMFNEMVDRTRLLQRNVSVIRDQTHEFGIRAFSSLPEKIAHVEINTFATNNEISSSSLFELESDQDSDNLALDTNTMMKKKIDKIRVPSTFGLKIISIVIFLIAFCVPIIAVLIYAKNFVNTLAEPLDFMHDLSKIRSNIFQVVAFSMQYLLEYFGVNQIPQPVIDSPPEQFGYSWETRVQIGNIGNKLAEIIQNVGYFQSYNSPNDYIDQAKLLILGDSINYKFYSEGLTYTIKQMDIVSVIADMLIQISNIVSHDVIPDDIINTTAVLNPTMNVIQIADTLDAALNLITSGLEEDDKSKQRSILMVTYVGYSLAVVVYFLSILLQVFWISSNKQESYKCLTSLPKNTVSLLAENLRILKQDNDGSSSTLVSSEISKQEDHILKIFVNGTTKSSAKALDVLILCICSVLSLIIYILAVYFLGDICVSISRTFRRNCPHLNNLQGIYANYLAAQWGIAILVGRNSQQTKIMVWDPYDVIDMMDEKIHEGREYYNLARFGGTANELPPFIGYNEGVEYASNQYPCNDEYEKVSLFLQASRCFTMDNIIILFEAIDDHYILPVFNNTVPLAPSQIFTSIWSLLIFPIYDSFIYPMHDQISNSIKETMLDGYKGQIPYIIALIIISFLVEIFHLIYISMVEKHVKDTLRLLLHCPPKQLLATPKAMKVLAGDFSKDSHDSSTRTPAFFKQVVDDLPNSVFICDSKNTIERINKSAEKIFGTDIVNTDIQLFLSKNFEGNSLHLIDNPIYPIKETLIFNNGQIHFEAISAVMNQRIIIEFRDITQQVRYNSLISEERSKVDVLLSSILPPTLVKRVNAGEKNISFVVQSATIVFMDIVSFTPWCSSIPADKVMSTLNNLFKKLDALVNKYQTMTKIKCIGDCYMAAGGVFSEINIPAEHAKDVVNFGLDSLVSIQQLNSELNEKLQMRVGINTGGPIVAGVLGIGKPTFEILGPAINTAQQMEHHGVPMAVHISRSVYELIYGDTFMIKERGNVEVKNGTVITYLVSKNEK
ncbi:Adenylate and Guanylate cyclase catalytic domain containing protein [Tritrichomonas foetus]|uniref:Adenylate and Guanylate cyclase catalytic domain containing protein n=1 Tax=Tritrichomonas foetus TaxID=1144522 RepID=A0A1J4K1J4_9EUKA|nr:Adenylate and Guanylate cyclase catalytic domain containing protein [Tritrichomonas foetus]|eukprot:OHT05305.1 Adenylate and Guanylate cyclase catalytic domain containing protein [Tritrichomonas foetus]